MLLVRVVGNVVLTTIASTTTMIKIIVITVNDSDNSSSQSVSALSVPSKCRITWQILEVELLSATCTADDNK